MLKIAGAIMIFIACVGIGYGKGREYKQRIRQLLLEKRMVCMLRGEIQYAFTPLPDAFLQIAGRMDNLYGVFLKEVSVELKKQDARTLGQVWEEKAKEILKESALTKEDIKQLQALGGQLGYLDTQMQLSTIEMHLEQLENKIMSLEQEQGKRSRVCRCLGVFAGVMLNLILL